MGTTRALEDPDLFLEDDEDDTCPVCRGLGMLETLDTEDSEWYLVDCWKCDGTGTI